MFLCFVFGPWLQLVDDPAEGRLISGAERVKTSAEYSVSSVCPFVSRFYTCRRDRKPVTAQVTFFPLSPQITIIGARKLSQLQDNLASFDLALSAEQVKALDEASQIDPGFPYHLYTKEQVRAIAYGGMRDQIMA